MVFPLSNLMLIGEGGAPLLEYLLANGVHPTDAVFDVGSVQSLIPYLSAEDELLVIVHGLTDFTMASLHAMFDLLYQYVDVVSSLTVLSDVPLSLKRGYFMYSGDLFFGSVWYHGEDGKDYLVEAGKPTDVLLSKASRKQLSDMEAAGNTVMHKFMVYNNDKRKTMLHGEAYLKKPFTVRPPEIMGTPEVVSFDNSMPVPFQVSSS